MNALLKFVAKQLFAQKGVIANNKAVNFEAAKLAEKLSEFGIDPSSIKTEKQLEGIVNQIKELQKKRMAESMEVISQDDPRFKGIMDKMMGSNVIKRDFGKPFKEEIKKMETEAEIAKRIKKDNKKGIANIQKRILEEDREIENLYGGAGFGKDQEIDAEFLAEYLAENAGKVYDDLPTMERLDFYDRAFNALTRYKRTKGTSVIDEPKKLDPRTKEKMDDIKEIEDPEDMADGGRIGFKKGMDRRTFMKLMGGITAVPILGKFFKGAEVAAPVIEKAKDVASGAPPYFFNLVDRIRALGKKFDGPKERSESYVYKDYEMDIDLDTGAIDIKKTKEAMIPGGDEAGVAEEVIMTYKPGMADETTKGKRVVDEYEEFTARPDIDGKMKDVEDGVPDEVVREGSIGKEELEQEIVEQIARDKKASGGIAMMLGQ
jgi:hypothetical protein